MKTEVPRLTVHRSGERTITIAVGQLDQMLEREKVRGENRALRQFIRLLLGKDEAPGGDP